MTFNPEEAAIIVKDFTKTYLESSKCKGVVVGLSGGIDSAVTALLCQKALGNNKLKCLFFPEETTPKDDIKHVELLKKKYNFNVEEKNITNLVNETVKNCVVKPNDFAKANIKARIRMVLLYEYSNVHSLLVAGTSNKSELLVGYTTKYGDAGVDFMPIGDIYKTQIFELARFLKLPEEIIKKPPSAGLMCDQKDENELKISYKDLDKILMGLEKKYEIDEISIKYNLKTDDIERIKNMRRISQHKRRGPLIPKIGLRTPGLDWRSPVQEG